MGIYKELDVAALLAGLKYRKRNITISNKGRVGTSSGNAIFLAEPHGDWSAGTAFDLMDQDGVIAVHFEFEDTATASLANRTLFQALAGAVGITSRFNVDDKPVRPGARFCLAAGPKFVTGVYSPNENSFAFDLVDVYGCIASTVSYAANDAAQIGQRLAVEATMACTSILSGFDFIFQESWTGSQAEMAGDCSKMPADWKDALIAR